MSTWTLVIFLLFSSMASAFDIFPEYQGLTEADLLKFERPADLDAEYQSRLNSYTVRREWDQLFSNQSRALDLSVGSLSNKHFYQYARLKLDSDLTDSLRFRFIYFAQRDREVDQTRHVLELSQMLTPSLRLAFYGESSLYKRENDLGLAFEGYWQEFSQRLYVTAHDLVRGDHNDQPDGFSSRGSPTSFGWTGAWNGEQLRASSGFRIDSPVTWLRPQEQRVFEDEKKLAFGDFYWRQSVRQIFGLRLQWDSTFKGQKPDSSSSAVVEESWAIERHMSRVSYALGLPEDARSYEVGMMYAGRQWKNQNGSKMAHSNFLPSVNINWRGVRRGNDFDQIRAGYEMTVFNSTGDLALTVPTQKHNSVENRLVTGYEFSFRSNAKLLLALNFDLDELQPLPTFEGGNSQFRTDF